MAIKFVPPDLSNATPEFLIDEMAKLSVIENYTKKLRKYYKEAFYGRTGIDVDNFANGQEVTNSGDTFFATTSRSDPERIDTGKVKAEYPDVAEACTVSQGQLTTRFFLKDGATNPLVNDLLEQMKAELDLE